MHSSYVIFSNLHIVVLFQGLGAVGLRHSGITSEVYVEDIKKIRVEIFTKQSFVIVNEKNNDNKFCLL